MAIVPDRAGVAPLDRPYWTYNRKATATPQATVVPLYAGEIFLDSTTGKLYKALGLTNDTWSEISASVGSPA